MVRKTPDITPSHFGNTEEGSSLILVIFAAALVIAVALGVTAATSLYLERKRLLSLADGASLVGAEAYDLADVVVVNGIASPRLTPERVSTSVREYLTFATPSDLGNVRLDSASTLDGRSATVVLSTVWHPPVVSFVMPAGMRIDVTSTARSVFSTRAN